MIVSTKPIIKICFLLILLANPLVAPANDTAEREHLAALIRQLQLMQQMTEQHVADYPQNRSRYYFDFKRLNTDLKRIESGINDYLIPKRAQPRDLSEISGYYTQRSQGDSDE